MNRAVYMYAQGLVAASVCAPADMGRDEIKAAVDRDYSCGLENGWVFDPAPTFKSGQPNPCLCEREPGRLHYLMHC